jgi:hypothetical protein
MEAVDVLRPHPLGQLALGPREREVDLRVESLLRRHARGLRPGVAESSI